MKKRILSLILALSMVLSVLPLGAFAADPPELVMGANGLPVYSDGTTGDGWEYKGGTLTLEFGDFDFSSTHPQNTSAGTQTAPPVRCAIVIKVPATITGGTFAGSVTNNNIISNGIFEGTVTNEADGIISNGTFKGNVKNNIGGEIIGGTFAADKTVTNSGTIEGDGTFNGDVTNDTTGKISGGTFNGTVTNDTNAAIENGKFTGTVTNSGTIENGTFQSTCSVENKGANAAIENGIFDGGVTNGGTIKNGIFDGTVTNNNTISGGFFEGTVTNNGTITGGGTFNGTVINNAGGEIADGTFAGSGSVENNTNGTIYNGNFNGTVTNNGTIKNGTFKDVCSVTNEGTNATIENGTFKNMCRVINNSNGTISGGTFKNKCRVENNAGGTISGGTFAGSVSNNGGTVNGGIFNGNTSLDGVTNLHSITVASNAKIEKVNGVSADWAPYVVTSNATTKDVTITADTEIFSLNGQPIAESSYGVDKKTVTFTMPDENVVLNGTITSTDLVMENGWPKDSNGGKNPCKGDGWEYIPNDPTYGNMLLLTGSNQTGGLFDFSTIGDGSAVKCNVFVGKPTAITGGEFNGKVFNNSGILGGTFHGEVDNRAPGIIKGGTFNGAVENNGIIEKGTFNGAVTGSGTVSESITGSGTLNGELITKTPESEPEPEPTTYTVTVIGGTIDGKTSVSAKENDTLTVVLDESDIPDGMTFDMWSISSSKLSGDINVDYRAEAMPFKMPAEDVTIRAQYRSAEIIEDAAPSPLATAATIAVGGAAAGIVVWQGVSLGVDLYLANALPQGVPVPTDRRALALLLWETAGKPEVALPTLYGDIPAEEIELQKATRWAVQNGLMDAADKKDASFFDPDHYVTKMDVVGAWLRLKKLLGTT